MSRSQIIDNTYQIGQNMQLLKTKSAKIPPEGIVKFCKKEFATRLGVLMFWRY